MKNYKETRGDLIKMALDGQFDVIAHGCNCFCIQGVGIAKQMAKTFRTAFFKKEKVKHKGNFNKLGNIDWNGVMIITSDDVRFTGKTIYENSSNILYVINAYTQYQPGSNLDYDAFTLCMRKINHIFKGKSVGLPQIGCGIAGGDWNKVKQIIQSELKDCDVTIVIYEKS